MKYLLILIFLVGLLLACKKKEIKFEDVSQNTTGALDTNNIIQTTWTTITTPGITNISHIETDGTNIYFDGTSGGMNKIFKLIPNGTISELYTAGPSTISGKNATHLSYHPPYMYACHKELSNNAIKIFNEAGIVQTIDFNSTSNNQINDIQDMGTYLLLAGKAEYNTQYPYGNIAALDKTTGTLSQAFNPGVGGGIFDIENINGTIYVAGSYVKPYSNIGGYGLAKWTGTSWIGIGAYELDYSGNYTAPYITSIEYHQNKIYVGGILSDNHNLALLNDDLSYTELSGFYTGYNSKIQMKTYNDVLYMYQNLTCHKFSFNSVYYLKNDTWHAAGILAQNDKPSDITILDGYIYGIVNGIVKKCKL